MRRGWNGEVACARAGGGAAARARACVRARRRAQARWCAWPVPLSPRVSSSRSFGSHALSPPSRHGRLWGAQRSGRAVRCGRAGSLQRGPSGCAAAAACAEQRSRRPGAHHAEPLHCRARARRRRLHAHQPRSGAEGATGSASLKNLGDSLFWCTGPRSSHVRRRLQQRGPVRRRGGRACRLAPTAGRAGAERAGSVACHRARRWPRPGPRAGGGGGRPPGGHREVRLRAARARSASGVLETKKRISAPRAFYASPSPTAAAG